MSLFSIRPGIAPHCIRCSSPLQSIGHRPVSCASDAAQHRTRHPSSSPFDSILSLASRPAPPILTHATKYDQEFVLDVKAPNPLTCGSPGASHSSFPMPNCWHCHACDPCSGGCLAQPSLHSHAVNHTRLHPLTRIVSDVPWPSAFRVYVSVFFVFVCVCVCVCVCVSVSVCLCLRP